MANILKAFFNVVKLVYAMKIFFYFLLSVNLFSSGVAGIAFDGTINLPWKEGQIVAGIMDGKDDPLYHCPIYRVFIKKVAEGYLVQEFYKDSNKKRTNPFVLKKIDDVTYIPYGYFTNLISELSIDGSFVIWYENGQKMQEGYYVDGKKDGLWSRWYENGQKLAEGVVKKGELEGLWQLWYKDGHKMNELYYKDGKLETVLAGLFWQKDKKDMRGNKDFWLDIDEKGYIRSQVMLSEGKKEGLWMSWDDKGKKEMLGHYKDDKRDGLWQTFWLDINETKKSQGYYKKGKKEGVWVFWNEQGKQIKEELYQEGKLVRQGLSMIDKP